MGPPTELNGLLYTAVKLFIYCYHIIDQETLLTLIPFMITNLTGLLYAPVDVLSIESSKQPNITSTEPSSILINELG